MTPHEAAGHLLGEENVGPALVMLVAAEEIDVDRLQRSLNELVRFESVGFIQDPTMFREMLGSRYYEDNRKFLRDLIRVATILKPHVHRTKPRPQALAED